MLCECSNASAVAEQRRCAMVSASTLRLLCMVPGIVVRRSCANHNSVVRGQRLVVGVRKVGHDAVKRLAHTITAALPAAAIEQPRSTRVDSGSRSCRATIGHIAARVCRGDTRRPQSEWRCCMPCSPSCGSCSYNSSCNSCSTSRRCCCCTHHSSSTARAGREERSVQRRGGAGGGEACERVARGIEAGNSVVNIDSGPATALHWGCAVQTVREGKHPGKELDKRCCGEDGVPLGRDEVKGGFALARRGCLWQEIFELNLHRTGNTERKERNTR